MWLNCRDCGTPFTLTPPPEEPLPEAQCLRCWEKARRNAFIPLLGTMSDPAIAAMAGISTPAVWYWRHKRQVPVFGLRCTGDYAYRYQAYVTLLGEHPGGLNAAAVAREMHVSREAARTMLQRLEARCLAYRRYVRGGKRPLWCATAVPSTNEEPIV